VGIFVEGLGPRTWRIHHLPSLASSLLVAGLRLGFLEGEVDPEPAIKNKQKYIPVSAACYDPHQIPSTFNTHKTNLHDRVLKAMTLAPEHKSVRILT
jgi:hypothetical protein